MTATNGHAVKSTEDKSYPALKCEQNGHTFYVTTIPVADLFPWTFVISRADDPSQGFQRVCDEKRATEISEYLTAADKSIAQTITLSAQARAKLTYNRSSKTISFDRVKKAFTILDGQHRLLGFAKCPKPLRVPVAIYEELPRSTEAALFIDVNTKSRPVPATLLADIKLLANIESAREAILRDLYDRLSSDEKSPLHGRTSAAVSAPGKLTRVAFNRALGPALAGGTLAQLDAEGRFKMLKNFLSAVQAELHDKELLFKPSYLSALGEILDDVAKESVLANGDLKPASLQVAFRPVARLDLTSEGLGARPTKKLITGAMRAAMREPTQVSKEML